VRRACRSNGTAAQAQRPAPTTALARPPALSPASFLPQQIPDPPRVVRDLPSLFVLLDLCGKGGGPATTESVRLLPCGWKGGEGREGSLR
jgi:hypothetical protein